MQITQEVVLFLICEPFTQHPTSVPDFSSFESCFLILKLPPPHAKLSVCIVPFTQVQGIGHLRNDDRLEFLR